MNQQPTVIQMICSVVEEQATRGASFNHLPYIFLLLRSIVHLKPEFERLLVVRDLVLTSTLELFQYFDDI